MMKNPELIPLLGGIHAVILGDSEAKRRGDSLHKTVLERQGAPTFGVVIELTAHKRMRIYHNIADIIDSMLAGKQYKVETRWKSQNYGFLAKKEKVGTEKGLADWFEGLKQELNTKK